MVTYVAINLDRVCMIDRAPRVMYVTMCAECHNFLFTNVERSRTNDVMPIHQTLPYRTVWLRKTTHGTTRAKARSGPDVATPESVLNATCN